MTYKDILRNKPWLEVVHTGNLCNRMLKATNGNAFVVYNKIHRQYQLHTVEAELLSGDSANANIPQEVLNEWIIDNYNMNDFNKYVDDIKSANELSEHLNGQRNSDYQRELELTRQLKTIERVIGTSI